MMKTQVKKQIKTVHCPYIPDHVMPESSLLNHLTKCTATNKNLFTKCRYNPIHVYPNEQIEKHYKKCKDRMRFQIDKKEQSDSWGSGNETTQIERTVQQKNKKISQKADKNNSINQSSIQKGKTAYEYSSDGWSIEDSDDEANKSKLMKDKQISEVLPIANQSQNESQVKAIKNILHPLIQPPENDLNQSSRITSFSITEQTIQNNSLNNSKGNEIQKNKNNSRNISKSKENYGFDQESNSQQSNTDENAKNTNNKNNKLHESLQSLESSQKSRDNINQSEQKSKIQKKQQKQISKNNLNQSKQKSKKLNESKQSVNKSVNKTKQKIEMKKIKNQKKSQTNDEFDVEDF